MLVTRLDRLARSTRDVFSTLATIIERKAGFRSFGDAWADTTTAHGRLMLTVLGGLAEFERELIRAWTGEAAPVLRRAARVSGDHSSSRHTKSRRRLRGATAGSYNVSSSTISRLVA